jgi:hypothetical protein
MEYKKPKASGYSTSRGTRVKHSTAMDWDEWEEKKRKYPVKYATGEDGRITHSTGRELDAKVKLRRKEYEDDKRGGAKHPGFTYKHYRKKDKSQSEDEKKASPKSFKKVIIEY